jgi:predicted HicB family RNase H-like nuclease
MVRPLRAKQERIIEAVRHGLEGDAALAFIHQSGFAMNAAGIARNLRQLGGRGMIQDLINEGHSNAGILASLFPGEDFSEFHEEPPSQQELFTEDQLPPAPAPFPPAQPQPFETTKMTIRVPTDVYEAINLAARAESVKRNDLIVDILTGWLSRMPGPAVEAEEEQESG